jgi:hypothetical protein
MIYTCYDMVRDCRANRPEGWRYFISNYLPVIQKLLDHYAGNTRDLDRVLLAVRGSGPGLFDSLEPAPERWFVARLRQNVLAEMAAPVSDIPLGLEDVAEALGPLTLTEKQAAWTESMSYTPEAAGAMLRMAPATVAKIRDRAAELLRARGTAWRRTILAENGRALGRAASEAAGPECLGDKTFLDVLDGRSTWSGREEMERHVGGCWHCIDHFCRLAEVIELLRGARPLPAEEAHRFIRLLNLPGEERSLWQRLRARGRAS